MAFERIRCPRCDLTFGQEARFLDHLVDVHGIPDHLALYLELHHCGIHPTCQCSSDCQEKLSWSGWKKGFLSKFVRGHNARVDSVYLDPARQAEFAKKRADGYAGGKYKVWNDGLTKETSAKVAGMAVKTSATLQELYSSGYNSWQSGKTKEEDPRVANMAASRVAALRAGEIHVWNKGLTKEDDPRVELLSQKLSALKQAYDPRRLTPAELLNRVEQFPQFSLVTPPSEYRNKYQRLKFKCIECGTEQEKNLMMLESTPVCFSCHPKESKGQLELLEFVRSLGVEAASNDRTVLAPLEVDVWVPSHKFGVEYNGLYWHSSLVIADQKYHQAKHDAARAAGVSLFSVYEDEWRDRRPVVEGMLRHRLKMPVEVLDARKLRVEQLDSAVATGFFQASHLEGATRSVASFGLVDGSGRVVAASSLRRPFHKRHSDTLEVARSATLPGVAVRGWLGKLTPHLARYASSAGMKGLMTYVDGRVGAGVGYEAAGWKLERASTGPRFWWTDFERRYNRFKFKADKSRGMTQAQVAQEAGVVEIYGCSNSSWRLDVVP